MINLTNVSKSYGKKEVLANIDLNFADAHGVYGLLGRNGVGKTTLLMMLANQIADYTGDITYNGETVLENDKVLNNILLFGNPFSKDSSLQKEKLKNIVAFYDEAIETFDKNLMNNLMTRFELDPQYRYDKLSAGNKTMFTNALAVAGRTPVTLIDEPTSGLDSINRQQFFRALMEDYTDYPRMFVVSTHLIAEVENYLTHAIFMEGKTIVLDEDIPSIQAKAYRVTNFEPENKNIIARHNVAGISVVDVYDELSDQERQRISQAGGKVDSINLQDLFNSMLGGK